LTQFFRHAVKRLASGRWENRLATPGALVELSGVNAELLGLVAGQSTVLGNGRQQVIFIRTDIIDSIVGGLRLFPGNRCCRIECLRGRNMINNPKRIAPRTRSCL